MAVSALLMSLIEGSVGEDNTSPHFSSSVGSHQKLDWPSLRVWSVWGIQSSSRWVFRTHPKSHQSWHLCLKLPSLSLTFPSSLMTSRAISWNNVSITAAHSACLGNGKIDLDWLINIHKQRPPPGCWKLLPDSCILFLPSGLSCHFWWIRFTFDFNS